MIALFLRRLVFSFTLVALGGAVWFTPLAWRKLETWVEHQRDLVWTELETILGQDVVYRRIAPTVLSALDFQDVRLLAQDGTTVFQAVSIRLSWDWGLLFQGRFSDALRRVQVINATLALDTRRDQELINHWAGFFRPSAKSGGTSFGFQVEGYNLTVRVTDGKRTLALDRGFAVLSPEDREWGARFRGALTLDDRSGSGVTANLSVRGELRSDPAFQNLSLRAEASSVRSSLFDLQPVTVQVTVDPQLVRIAKVSDRMPVDLQLEWDRRNNRWRVRGAAEGFVPAQLVRLKLKGPWLGLSEGEFTGQFDYQIGGAFFYDGQASWPQGTLPEPLSSEPLTIAGRVALDSGRFQFTNFSAETTSFAGTFNGDLLTDTFLPNGSIVLDRGLIPGVGFITGAAEIERTGSKLAFRGSNWTLNSLGTASPAGWVEQTPQGWTYSIRGPLDGTPAGGYVAEGSFDTAGSQLDTSVELLEIPLSAFRQEVQERFPAIDLPPEAWALETTLSGHLHWGPGEGPQISVTSFAFHDPLVPDRLGAGALTWQGRHLDLALDPTSWDTVRAGGNFAADIEEDGAVSWTFLGNLWNRPVDLKGRWVATDRTLAFSGKPGVAGVLHQSDTDVWGLEMTLDPLELVPGWLIGFQGKAQLDNGRWSIRADRLTVASRYPWNQEAFSARGRAVADASFVRMDDLVVNDSHGSWAGSLISSWSLDFSSPWAGRLALATPQTGRESITLDWVGTRLDRWHLSVRAAGVDLARSGIEVAEGLSGRLTAAGSANWEGQDGTWNLQTALTEARWKDSPLGFRANFSGTAHRVSVRSLNVALAPVRVIDGSADLDAGSLTWTSKLGVGVRLGSSDWESKLVLGGQWSSAGKPFEISATVNATANSWAQRRFSDWTVVGRWSPEAWQAVLGQGELSLSGKSDGSVAGRARAPFPLAGEFSGVWAGPTFQLGVRGFRADLGLVKEYVNSKVLTLVGGAVEGDFSLSGSPSDPELNGNLTLKDLSATSSLVRVPLGPVDVPIVLEGHRLRVDSVDIGPGAQGWMISGGARLDHFVPEEYQFSIQTDALSVIPISYQYTGLSAVGGVTGQLFLKGTPLAVTLGGRLVLQDAIITLKPTAVDNGAKGGEPLGFNADLTLITGRRVEFLWPNETLPLLRTVTASGQSIVVKANDVASTWSVAGKLALKTGEINYLNRTFVLREGLMVLQEDQTRFDPHISVRAEWRIREATGPVTISLRADGTLSAFSPRFDASPYKSPEELQQLVGTTLALPTDYSKATNMETAISLASDLTTSFLLTPFEDTVKQNFQLDLFTVKTEILKNTLVGRPESGNTSLEASDYLDNTRLFFGKYIGDDLFLQGTLAFRRDADVAAQASQKMVVEPELQMEFQTPLFLLNWTLLPQHPETLFVTDNTVTFRWNWSY